MVMNLFNDEALKTKAEIKSDKLKELEIKEAEKLIQENEKKRMKDLADSVNDSAFWMSYCGMQKAVRQCDVERSTRLAFVAWIKNPWFMYRRLHTILVEDIGGANPELILEFADFRKNGRSYKNWSDMAWMIGELARSKKCRDGDLTNNAWKAFTKYAERDPYIKAMKERHPHIQMFNKPVFSNYSRPEFPEFQTDENLKRILTYCEYQQDSLAGEGQALSVPYNCLDRQRREAAGFTVEIENNLTSPSHGEWFKDIVPYTVLDTHAAHGKKTMDIWKKKVKEREPEFKDYFGIDEENLPILLFFMEGAKCSQDFNFGGFRDPIMRFIAYARGLKPEIPFEEFEIAFHERMLVPLKGLRTWVFNKFYGKVVDNIWETIGKMKDFE